GDYEYIAEKGLETMIAIARFWAQRVNYSRQKSKYVILGVTGPNEYENNVNNNWYTNYLAQWSLEQTYIYLEDFKKNHPEDYIRIRQKVQLNDDEPEMWKEIVEHMYLPYDKTFEVYLQQDNFLDKEIIPATELDSEERPINQNWSWDRILRSCYIKQADVLQGFYFFESHFSKESLERHFDFYEPLTVHESSLSPCVHAVLAASLGKLDKAYEMYLRTSRLDLDDYNKEVKEGLHITSMAGTWMSIVEGFGGLRIKNQILSLNPQLPEQWKSLDFKINYRSQIIDVKINKNQTSISLQGNQSVNMYLFGELIKLEPNKVFQT
ncbi:MAG: glycosyl hydrolase family 65 protein, partial [Flavobacteriaceae bacterium]|nr:glycosyl hydrolase family 65 protein [Flavobacteriaceae bacterium]